MCMGLLRLSPLRRARRFLGGVTCKISNKRRRSFKVAVHERDGEVASLEKFVTELPHRHHSISGRMVHRIAEEFLPDPEDRKYYEDQYSCCPPPIFILFITLVELGFFTYYTLVSGEVNPNGPLPVDSIFLYRPDRRIEIWRFLLYMVLHAGWVHLLFNLLVQLLVGLPLEMVHGSLRIAIVYVAGVLAGSLGTSVFDTDVYLVGASGGVYALLAAHISNVLLNTFRIFVNAFAVLVIVAYFVLNYSHMECGIFRIFCIFIVASADVGFAIWNRYSAEAASSAHPVSYVAHLAGSLAGLTIGLVVLKNFERKLCEKCIWWTALVIYLCCMTGAILWNIFGYPLFVTTYEPLEAVAKS